MGRSAARVSCSVLSSETARVHGAVHSHEVSEAGEVIELDEMHLTPVEAREMRNGDAGRGIDAPNDRSSTVCGPSNKGQPPEFVHEIVA